MTKTVFITGAGAGIGYATAKAFDQLGYQLLVSDINIDSVKELAGQLQHACYTQVDVTQIESINEAFTLAEKTFGTIDIVHANAGVSNMKPAIELTESDWDFNLNVNAKGVFFTNQVAVRHFLKHKTAGIIINTASLAAKVGAPLLAHYSASKFAVLGWTQALAREHAKDNIRVNAVCPGFVKTPMQDREVVWEAALLNITPEEVRQSYITQTPLGRLCHPEDVADVVTFLASEQARFMTGQAINVTGGVYMA